MSKGWQHDEELVRAIEQSVSPGAIVKRNVFLPNIGSASGARSQCDVVIWEGSPARPVVTIVEVQRRNVKVKPNEFYGWLIKRDLVGAQKLVCVSRKGFTSAIKEQAEKEGGAVVLIHLRESSPMELPIDFIRFHLRFRYFAIVKIKNLRPGISRAHLETLGIRDEFFRKNNGRDVGSDEKIWSTDGMTVISLGDLIRCLTPVSDSFEGEAKISIDFDSKCPIFAYFDGVFIPAALEVEYEYVDKLYSIPMSTLTYEQLEYGSLGWVMEGSLETPLGKLESKIPIYKAENGMYKMRDSDVIIEGVKGVTMQIYREGFDEPWYG